MGSRRRLAETALGGVARFAVIFASVVSLAACRSPAAGSDGTWGAEAMSYFEGLAAAYSQGDFYGVMDFYTPSARIDGWRVDFTEGPIVGYLRVSPILARDVLAVHLGSSEALTLIRWPASGRYGAVESQLSGGSIDRETVFHDLMTVSTGARASADTVDGYVRLFHDYATAWSSGDAESVSALYRPDASVAETLTATTFTGHDAIGGLAADSGATFTLLSISDIAGVEHGPAIYLARGEYATDPGLAVGVFDVEDRTGCRERMAVRLSLEDGLVAGERRYPEVKTFDRCHEGALPDGWWTGRGLPGPRDQIVTHRIPTQAGEIAVHNGTDRLVDLVRWGLGRFTEAGLEQPRVSSVTFEPSRSCVDVSGRLVDGESARDLFLCFYESDACPAAGTCDDPGLGIRQAILHELGHAWLLDQADADTQRRFMDLTGLPTWADTTFPWHERGAEYAAEVLAWGLLDEPAPMVRIGSPPCLELSAAFTLLTDGTSAPLPPGAGC